MKLIELPKPPQDEDTRAHFAIALTDAINHILAGPQMPIGAFIIVQHSDGAHSRFRHLHEGTNLLSLVGIMECEKQQLLDDIAEENRVDY